MYIKEKVIAMIRKNTYWNECLWSNYKIQLKNEIENKIRELEGSDCIQNREMISQFRKEIERGESPYWSYDLNEVNFRMYGIGTSIFGRNSKTKVLYPSIEHGLILYPRAWTDSKETCRAGILTLGQFRKEILRKEYDIPIYTVGPYIQYASEYYTKEKREEIKRKLGRNLLVFLTHSTDQAEISFREKKYMEEILALRNEFDSINICAFWWNINDPFLKKWEKEGCNIVTAGYREDPMFLPRLKEIIGFSDLVLGDGVGTNIGYCINLKKPFRFLDIGTQMDIRETTKKEQDDREKHVERIKRAFSTEDYFNSEQMKVYNYYWGGDIHRTEREIESIFELNKQITMKAKGYVRRFERCSKECLEKMSEKDTQYKILEEALR